jgi:hypothetical protein
MSLNGTIVETKDIKQNYILAFGITKYQDTRFCPLESATDDVDCFVKTAIDYFYGFSETRVEKVFDKSATKISILENIQKVVAPHHKTSNANLIIYFSGHGYFTWNKGYIAPQDADKDDLRTFLSYERLVQSLKNAPFHHILIISDACHGGTIMEQNRTLYSGQNTNSQPSRWALTSNERYERIGENNRLYSLFSKALVQVLIKKRNPEIKTLTLSDIQGDMQNLLLSLDASQKPNKTHLDVEGFKDNNGEFVFYPRECLYDEAHRQNDPRLIEQLHFDRSTELIVKPREAVGGEKVPFTSVFLLLLVIFSAVATISRTKNSYNRPIEQGFIPSGLLDSPIVLQQWQKPEKIPTSQNIFIPMPGMGPSVGLSNHATTRFVRYDEKGNLVYVDEQKLNVKNRIQTTQKTDSTNVVFVGSFNEKENAQDLIADLRNIGFKEAEIVMKENLPYSVVVSGFYANKKEAKAKVESLKQRGFDVYLAKRYWRDIYRE